MTHVQDLLGYQRLERGATSVEALQRVHVEVDAEVKTAIERARSAPDAGAAELGFEDVYP